MKLKDKKIEILAVQSVINENGYAGTYETKIVNKNQ